VGRIAGKEHVDLVRCVRNVGRTAVRLQLPADQAIMPLCAAHSITISLTDRAADISLPSCAR
jgi:hypothetical protein